MGVFCMIFQNTWENKWIGLALTFGFCSSISLEAILCNEQAQKMAIRVIAKSLSEDEIAGLEEMFKMIDTDNIGQITFEELKAGLERVGSNLKESEIYALMQAADVDNSGTIDYGEFVATTLHLNKIEREDHLFAAFSYFDKDRSGYITPDELQPACEEFGIEDVLLEEMIRDVKFGAMSFTYQRWNFFLHGSRCCSAFKVIPIFISIQSKEDCTDAEQRICMDFRAAPACFSEYGFQTSTDLDAFRFYFSYFFYLDV